MSYRILEGDCREVLREFDAESVQTCVTSPPYWGLRDYGAEGQLGLEPTPEQYVENMVAVFREVRRVLRDDGTLWLNLGDSYAGGGVMDPGSHTGLAAASERRDGKRRRSENWARQNATVGDVRRKRPDGLKPKDLVGIPWMVAFALRADGWYLRSEIIWHKPAPMPESVRDRPTKSHEQMFLLAKSPRYFYDDEAIREPAQDWGTRERSGPLYDGTVGPQPGVAGLRDTVAKRTAKRTVRPGVDTNGGGQGRGEMTYPAHSRNKRTVWTVNPTPFPGAHFATFPPKLVEPCVLAGAAEGDTVLDPFAGAGTTGLVACRYNRDFIGIELNPDYAQMARNRIHNDAPLLNVEAA